MTAQAAPIALTESGKVRGQVDSNVFVFRGIPYGADTAGRRFLPPQKPTPWRDVLDCLEFGPKSPQPPETGIYGLFHDSTASENCLVLNVWTPGLRDGVNRPVMVWLHGGGFFSFSGATAFSDGLRFAARGDVILVTLNHRLGVLGFTHLEEKLGERYADSGNAGLYDIVLALQWIRNNITEFGGDPDNVTIFGESGGGAKVSALMAVPAAKNLFHKAIVQSGSALRMREKQAAKRVTEAYLDVLGLPISRADQMTTMPLDQLMAPSMVYSFDQLMNMSPVVGGELLPRHPFDPDAPEVSAAVPMLIGSCHDESTLMYGLRDPSLFELTWDSLSHHLTYWIPGTDPEPIINAYQKNHPSYSASDVFFGATCDFGILRAAITQAERKCLQPAADVYMYEFDYESERDGGKFKATHADELVYVFDTLEGVVKAPSLEMLTLVNQMSESWIAFSRGGNPNNKHVPAWPRYDLVTRMTMAFGRETKAVSDPRSAERGLFSKISTVIGPFEFLQGVPLRQLVQA